MPSYHRSAGGYYYQTLASGKKVRISKEKYLKNKTKAGKHNKSKKAGKRRSPKRKSKSVCRDLVGDKIALNMREFKEGKWQNRSQAIAVSFSQVQAQHPRCRRFLRQN